MGFKSIEIIIEAPIVLNELPMYWETVKTQSALDFYQKKFRSWLQYYYGARDFYRFQLVFDTHQKKYITVSGYTTAAIMKQKCSTTLTIAYGTSNEFQSMLYLTHSAVKKKSDALFFNEKLFFPFLYAALTKLSEAFMVLCFLSVRN